MSTLRTLAFALCLAAPAALAAPGFALVGQDGQERTLTAAELEALGAEDVTVPDPHTQAPTRYRAVALPKVLALAGFPSDAPVRGPLLAARLLVEAADGYKVVFSFPELDPRTGSTQVLVAFALDGEPLGDDIGPFRLLVPTDRRGARWVRQLTHLRMLP